MKIKMLFSAILLFSAISILSIAVAMPQDNSLVPTKKELKAQAKQMEMDMMATPLSHTYNASPEMVKAGLIRGMRAKGYELSSDTQMSITFVGRARGRQAFGYSLGAKMSGRRVDQLVQYIMFEVLPDPSGTVTVETSCSYQERSTLGSNVANQGGCGDKGTHQDILSVLDLLSPPTPPMAAAIPVPPSSTVKPVLSDDTVQFVEGYKACGKDTFINAMKEEMGGKSPAYVEGFNRCLKEKVIDHQDKSVMPGG